MYKYNISLKDATMMLPQALVLLSQPLSMICMLKTTVSFYNTDCTLLTDLYVHLPPPLIFTLNSMENNHRDAHNSSQHSSYNYD